MLIKRAIEPIILKLSRQYPIITIVGPRQSGKTTLSQKLFPKKPYISCENLDIRRQINSDPQSFLKRIHSGAILDEIQKAPDFLSYLQTHVDQTKGEGRFILTGSAQFEMLSHISQSLAGRTSITTLLPFSIGEAYPKRKVPSLEAMLFTGFYPRIFDKKLEPSEAMASYCSTYIERDVRQIVQVRDLGRFETFIRLAGNRTAQILNLSDMGNDAGINHNTIKDWVTILEASYIVTLLKPHFNNLNKRLIKSPKIHLLDTGLACYLLNISDPKQLEFHPLKGFLFESMVVSELLKQQVHRGKQSNLYYWRDNTGHEIDILLDFGTAVLPIEVKSGQTVASDYFANLNFYRKHNPRAKKAVLIYGGDQSYVENDVLVLSYRDLPLLSELDYRLIFPI